MIYLTSDLLDPPFRISASQQHSSQLVARISSLSEVLARNSVTADEHSSSQWRPLKRRWRPPTASFASVFFNNLCGTRQCSTSASSPHDENTQVRNVHAIKKGRSKIWAHSSPIDRMASGKWDALPIKTSNRHAHAAHSLSLIMSPQLLYEYSLKSFLSFAREREREREREAPTSAICKSSAPIKTKKIHMYTSTQIRLE